MYSLRRLRKHAVATSIITIVSICVLISVGEGFKVIHIKPDGVVVGKRDGATITLNLPWKSPLDKGIDKPPVIKTPIVNGANTALDAVQTGGDVVKDVSQDTNNLVSVAISKGANKVSFAASILGEATALFGIVIDESPTSSVAPSEAAHSMIPSGGSMNQNPTSLSKSPSLPTSNALGYSSQTSGNNYSAPTSPIPSNMLSSSQGNIPPTSTYCAPPPPVPTSSSTRSSSTCPTSGAIICTVTETWHSTHYESTATMYSFMNTLTITYTETASMHSSSDSSDPFSFTANATVSSSSSGPCPSSSALLSSSPSPTPAVCPNGDLAEYGKDCPPATDPSNMVATCSGKDCGILPSLNSAIPTNPCKDKDCNGPPFPSINLASVTSAALGLLPTSISVDQALAPVAPVYGDTLPGIGGFFGKDFKAVDNSQEKGVDTSHKSHSLISPHIPVATFNVKPLPIEQKVKRSVVEFGDSSAGAEKGSRRGEGGKR